MTISRNADLNIVAENLTELLTSVTNMTSAFYNIFLNPEPMDVELQMYDSNNQLITVEIPNRAKDKAGAYTGEGTPNGFVAAPVGSAYVDTLNNVVYYKTSGNDQYGWVAVVNESLMRATLVQLLIDGGYITETDLSRILENEGYVKTTDIATKQSAGVIKIDDSSNIVSNGTLLINGVVASGEVLFEDDDKVRKLWTGTDVAFGGVTTKDAKTFYVTTDTGKIYLGNSEIKGSFGPVSSSGTYTSLALGTSPCEYTAVADGWIMVGAATAQGIGITYANGFGTFVNNAGGALSLFLPVKKGNTVTVSYTSITGGYVRFYYT